MYSQLRTPPQTPQYDRVPGDVLKGFREGVLNWTYIYLRFFIVRLPREAAVPRKAMRQIADIFPFWTFQEILEFPRTATQRYALPILFELQGTYDRSHSFPCDYVKT